jgi:carbon catabolite-derepressing protein kinase
MPAYHAALMSGTALPPHQPSHSGMGPGSSKFTPVLTNTSATAAKRPKPTKWQFGIRSRNAPLEAVSCIYRALKRLGAEWVDHTVPEPREPRQRHGSGDGEDGEEDEEHDEDEETEGDNKKPKDPWIIQARWRKIAKIPTTDHPRSQEPGPAVREVSTFVHLTIQLYQLEHDNYLVDFKCAGYEPEKKSTKKKRVGFEEVLGGDSDGKLGREGQKEDYKEVNSPFPFLDAAGALIVALAEAGD